MLSSALAVEVEATLTEAPLIEVVEVVEVSDERLSWLAAAVTEAVSRDAACVTEAGAALAAEATGCADVSATAAGSALTEAGSSRVLGCVAAEVADAAGVAVSALWVAVVLVVKDTLEAALSLAVTLALALVLASLVRLVLVVRLSLVGVS